MKQQLFVAAGAVLVLLAPVTGRLRAQAPQSAAPHESGIFVVLPGESAETQIKGSVAQQKNHGIAKSIITQGFSKPSLEMDLNGSEANFRLAAGDATFHFYFPEARTANTPPPMPDLTMAASMMSNMYSALPAQTKNGANDFALLRLQVTDGARLADMGKSPGNKPKDPIAFVSEKTGPLSYTVKTKEPLPPGEYAFTFLGMGSAGGIFWDFGLTGK